ncbi:hypothetical protein HK104_007466, partial [Borealophlyctis nickersoniae]
MRIPYLLSLAVVPASLAATLDLNDKAALGQAASKATANLVDLFKQGGTQDGAFDQKSVSWFQ